MEIHIAEREKLSYIRGKTKPPVETEDGYEKWYAENQKVKRLLLMSMTPEIMKRYLRLPTSYEIWSALSKAFYDGSDELQVFALSQKAQSSKTLSEYYGELTEVFRELDHLHHATLNAEYGDLEASAMVTRPGNPEASSMVARHRFNQNWQNHPETNNGSDKSTYKCTQCNQTGHTKSQCFELVGYPEWWDHSHDTRKKNSKRPSTVAIAETKSEDDIAEKGSALMLTTNNGGELDLRGMPLDTNGDKSIEVEDIAPIFELNPCIILNQSSVADVPDIVSKPFLK
ncbi:hypothetical protein DKX38_018510 [Salix brachista]|uniref:CCHC-type domain-containing protein n=1 Tax=Salix brachista TaxID=2182728 RepID=A0A5N5KNA3_9ROSI|nr:hypothetical protein DKX38_018510 [Salix brachista]